MKAFVVSELDGQLARGIKDVDPTPADDGDVLVEVDYSSVNFKDTLVAAVPSRVRRVSSLVGGVDAAGTIVSSTVEHLVVGARVAVHGGALGVGRDGGFAPLLYSPARHVSLLPSTISTFDAMVIGTAGFTAMASVLALEERGLSLDAPVLVTGATGGVGSQAVTYLAAKGYAPVASTGSPNAAPWIIDRGATKVIARDEISDRPGRVLGSEIWAGAVDCVGGSTLHEILRTLRYGASVAASGLLTSGDVATTIYPFITRAVSLLGIDAVEATDATREKVWSALGDVAPGVDFAALVDRVIDLDELSRALDDVRAGTTRGRIVVRLTSDSSVGN